MSEPNILAEARAEAARKKAEKEQKKQEKLLKKQAGKNQIGNKINPKQKFFNKRWKKWVAGTLLGLTTLGGGTAATLPITIPLIGAALNPDIERMHSARQTLQSDIKVYYSNGEILDALENTKEKTKLQFKEYEEINPLEIIAIESIEDKDFRDHFFGNEYKGTVRAFYNLVRYKKEQGGSTVLVQTSKQIFGGRVTAEGKEGYLLDLKHYLDEKDQALNGTEEEQEKLHKKPGKIKTLARYAGKINAKFDQWIDARRMIIAYSTPNPEELNFLERLLVSPTFSATNEIITLYADSMQVTGDFKAGGKIGIAESANYFFSKKQENLDLIESLAIAAMLKGPDEFDPFKVDLTKKTNLNKKSELEKIKEKANKEFDKNKYESQDSFIQKLCEDREQEIKDERMQNLKDRMHYYLPKMEKIFAQEVALAQHEYEQAQTQLSEGNFSKEGLSILEHILKNYEQAEKKFLKELDDASEKLKDPAYKIPFKHGTESYDQSSVARMVEKEVKKLQDLGVLPTPLPPGSAIYTTLNKKLQDELRLQLKSRAGQTTIQIGLVEEKRRVGGYTQPLQTTIDRITELEEGSFQHGRIFSIKGSDVTVDFGKFRAVIHKKGLEQTATSHFYFTQGSSSKQPTEKDFEGFLKLLHKDDIVYTSARKDAETGKLELCLEAEPGMQAAGIFLGHNGEILASVGNIRDISKPENNTTIPARPGSSIKPFVYLAAVQEGWKALGEDYLIKNTPQNFPFQTLNSSFPKTFPVAVEPNEMLPPAIPIVTTFAYSKNIATMNLASNLFEKKTLEGILSTAQRLHYSVKENDSSLHLLPFAIMQGETEENYKKRIEAFGINFKGTVGKIHKDIATFRAARKRIGLTLAEEERKNLLLFDEGYDYEKLKDAIYDGYGGNELHNTGINNARHQIETNPNTGQVKEYTKILHDLEQHVPYIKANYYYAEKNLLQIKQHLEEIKTTQDRARFDELVSTYLYNAEGHLAYSEDQLFTLDGQPLEKVNPNDLAALPKEALSLNLDNVWLNNVLKINTIERILEEKKTLEKQDPYTFEILSQHPDFRYAMALAKLKETTTQLDMKIEFDKINGKEDQISPGKFIGNLNVSPFDEAVGTLKEINPNAEPYLIESSITPFGFEYHHKNKEPAEPLPEFLELVSGYQGVTLYGTAKFMRQPRFKGENGTIVVRQPQVAYIDGKTGTMQGNKTLLFVGHNSLVELVGTSTASKAQEIDFSQIGSHAAIMKGYIGAEKMQRRNRGENLSAPEQEMKHGRIELFGASGPGSFVYLTIKSVFAPTVLTLPNTTYEAAWPETGRLIRDGECDLLDPKAGYCKQGTEIHQVAPIIRFGTTSTRTQPL